VSHKSELTGAFNSGDTIIIKNTTTVYIMTDLTVTLLVFMCYSISLVVNVCILYVSAF